MSGASPPAPRPLAPLATAATGPEGSQQASNDTAKGKRSEVVELSDDDQQLARGAPEGHGQQATTERPSKVVKIKDGAHIGAMIGLCFSPKHTLAGVIYAVHWPVPKCLIQRIPSYAEKLEAAEKNATDMSVRKFITDPFQRDEALMADVLDYVAGVGIQPIDRSSDKTRTCSVGRLFELSKLAKALGVQGLVHDTVLLISEELDLSCNMFVEIAQWCLNPASGLHVSDGSVIGRWIREYIAANLDKLEKGGHIDRITAQGGRLTSILVKATMDARKK